MCARKWGDENGGIDYAKLGDKEYRTAWRGLRNLYGETIFAMGEPLLSLECVFFLLSAEKMSHPKPPHELCLRGVGADYCLPAGTQNAPFSLVVTC